MATISDWTPEELQNFILKVINQYNRNDETEAEKDLTLEECCERWDLESPVAARCYAVTLGVRLRRDLSGKDTWPFEYLTLGDTLNQHIKTGGSIRDFPLFLRDNTDLTLRQCCVRWGVSSVNTIKDRAKAVKVELRRDSLTRTVWPSEYIALGDELDKHLKSGGTLLGFRAIKATAQPSASTSQKGRVQITIELDIKEQIFEQVLKDTFSILNSPTFLVNHKQNPAI